ncbi:MAG TPA: hypothetical protein VHZ09_02470 [Acidobacteriaceae bacterium]|nr:hypothetical protein [Acidobacteriaceae bacterium]
MRTRILAVLAYSAAALTLLVAILTPFLLMGFFTKAVAHAGLHIDPVYSGGTIARTLDRASAHGHYQVVVYQTVRPHALQRGEPFVQVVLRPVSALGSQCSEVIDLDGDGQPDVRIDLTVPADPHVRPGGSVVALNARFRSFSTSRSLASSHGRTWDNSSFSQLIVRTGDSIVVRVPLR